MPVKGIGFALLAVGVVLLIYGINASESVASSISEMFTGKPTDAAVWFIVGGIASIFVGAFLSIAPLGRRGGG